MQALLLLLALPFMHAQNDSDYRLLTNAPAIKINMNNYTNIKNSVIAVGNANVVEGPNGTAILDVVPNVAGNNGAGYVRVQDRQALLGGFENDYCFKIDGSGGPGLSMLVMPQAGTPGNSPDGQPSVLPFPTDGTPPISQAGEFVFGTNGNPLRGEPAGRDFVAYYPDHNMSYANAKCKQDFPAGTFSNKDMRAWTQYNFDPATNGTLRVWWAEPGGFRPLAPQVKCDGVGQPNITDTDTYMGFIASAGNAVTGTSSKTLTCYNAAYCAAPNSGYSGRNGGECVCGGIYYPNANGTACVRRDVVPTPSPTVSPTVAPTVSPTVAPTVVPTTSPVPPPVPDEGLNGGQIAGIVVGSLAGAGLLGGLAYMATRKRPEPAVQDVELAKPTPVTQVKELPPSGGAAMKEVVTTTTTSISPGAAAGIGVGGAAVAAVGVGAVAANQHKTQLVTHEVITEELYTIPADAPLAAGETEIQSTMVVPPTTERIVSIVPTETVVAAAAPAVETVTTTYTEIAPVETVTTTYTETAMPVETVTTITETTTTTEGVVGGAVGAVAAAGIATAVVTQSEPDNTAANQFFDNVDKDVADMSTSAQVLGDEAARTALVTKEIVTETIITETVPQAVETVQAVPVETVAVAEATGPVEINRVAHAIHNTDAIFLGNQTTEESGPDGEKKPHFQVLGYRAYQVRDTSVASPYKTAHNFSVAEDPYNPLPAAITDFHSTMQPGDRVNLDFWHETATYQNPDGTIVTRVEENTTRLDNKFGVASAVDHDHSADLVSAVYAPVETAIAQSAPVETTIVQSAPVETTIVQSAPVETTIVQGAPIETITTTTYVDGVPVSQAVESTVLASTGSLPTATVLSAPEVTTVVSEQVIASSVPEVVQSFGTAPEVVAAVTDVDAGMPTGAAPVVTESVIPATTSVGSAQPDVAMSEANPAGPYQKYVGKDLTATRPWAAMKDSELAVNKGDVITIQEINKDLWVYGYVE